MKTYSNNLFRIIEIIFIVAWLATMKNSDALFIPYLVVGVFGILCCYNRKDFGLKNFRPSTLIFSLIYTLFVVIANYALFPTSFSWSNSLQFIFQIISIILGSFVVFYNILAYTPALLKKIKGFGCQTEQQKLKPVAIFWISFGVIAGVYLLVLFLCKYPGVLTYDSVTQVEQVLTGIYSDHHPISSTALVALAINLGRCFSDDINFGIALYGILQIFIMAAVFSYSIMTLYQARCSKKIWIPLLVFYAIAPYNIMYSFTIWKDVLFSVFVLLLVVVQYRLFYCIGTKWLNYVILGLSVLLVCLFRHNGLYMCAVAILLFVVLSRTQIIKNKPLLLNVGIIGCVTIFYCILNAFILSTFQITPDSKAGSLSVPAQQIARTVKDSNNFTESQSYLLEQIMDIETVPEVYVPWVSDPVINEQINQSNGGEAFIMEHKIDYIKLYLELGLTHPVQYLQAWSDQTKGFYNGGYLYWVVEDAIYENDFGITRGNDRSIFNKAFNSYLALFEKDNIFRIIYCIGLSVWIAIWLLYCAILGRRKKEIFLIAIPMLLIGTLWIATPVFSEFRYAYPLICSLPFLLIVVLGGGKTPKTKKTKKIK